MKALKRPMFRMGGPIKEGIMDVMREPKKDGKIVGGKQSPLLAGAHPLKDAEGREHHFLPAIYAGGLAALNAARIAGPALVRGFKAARAFGATPGKLGFFGRAKDLATIRKGIGLPMATRPESIAFRIGSFAKQNPILSLSAPSLTYDAARVGGPLLGEAAKGVANFLVPGKALDPFKDKKPEDIKTDDTGLEVVDEFGKNEKGGEAVSQEVKDNITKDRIEENRKRYYKLMGIDKMKKDATYDSLIDASRIIQEQGGDLKGAVKSGSLQNAIIQAISKNLDKSADLKKQIDAAILKGEIEKDIKSADSLANDEKRARIKALERTEKAASAKGRINEIFATEGTIAGTTTAALLDNDGIKFDAILPDKELTKYQKDNPNKTEVDFFKSVGGSLEDGRYVVGRKLIEKRGGEIRIII
tara:strand:+ start:91 stop:1338 length:1248 start_codon:yes stop_codon:yes gene_type:complete